MERNPNRRLVSVFCIFTVVLFLVTFAAGLNAGWRPYSKGPLKGTDFNGTVPSPLPTEDGVEIKAKVTSGVSYGYAYSSSTSGGKVTVTPTKVTVESGTDPDASWNSDKSDSGLLDHEQGHADEDEIAAKKAQAEIDKLIKEGKLKGEGDTEAEAKADLEKKIDDIIKKHQDKKQKKYDKKTGHGTKDKEQKEERDRQKKELKDCSISTDNHLGPNAISSGLCNYHPVTGLTFDFTTIINVDPPVPDIVIGSNLVMPMYTLVGETNDGEFFFEAEEGAATVEIVFGIETLLTCDMPYMLYDPMINTFYGAGRAYDSNLAPGTSPYVDDVNDALVSDSLTLFGVEITPGMDFAAGTVGFMVPFSCPDTGTEGMRIVGALPLNCADVWAYDLGLDGDLNMDCYVNNEDVATLANDWLKCNNPLDANCVDF